MMARSRRTMGGPVHPRIVALLALCLLLPLGIPSASSSGLTADHWSDRHNYLGNCTQRPVHQYFYVNSSALAIEIIINFSANSSFPGASFALYTPDSFVAFAQNIDVLHYRTNITNMTKHGRWKVSLSVNFCSFTHPFEYDMWLVVQNRALTPPLSTVGSVRTDEMVDLDVSDLNLSQGERCRLNLGNGNVTPWFADGTYRTSYHGPGTYLVRSQVQRSDGAMTGWSQPLYLKVEGDLTTGDGTMTVSPGGSAIALVLIGLLIMVAFIASRR